MFIKLDNYIFNGDYNVDHINLYIQLFINKPSLSKNIKVTLDTLVYFSKLNYETRNVQKVKNTLNYLKEMEILDFYIDLNNLKRNDKFTIYLLELEHDNFYGFTKIEQADVEIVNKFTTNELVLYFFIKRYYNKSLGKAFCSYRFIEEKTGITNKTAQSIIDMFCIIGIIKKYNPKYYVRDVNGTIRMTNNEYKDFTNTPKPYKTLIKFDDVDKDTYTKLKNSRLYNEVEHTCYLGFGKNRKVKDTFKFLIPRTNVS